jgi:hypothetical protein
MSMWIIYRILMLCLASFLIFFVYFPLMHSLHYSKSENSNGGRILFLTSLSIPPSKYGLNDSAIISMTHLEFSLFSICIHR